MWRRGRMRSGEVDLSALIERMLAASECHGSRFLRRFRMNGSVGTDGSLVQFVSQPDSCVTSSIVR